MKVLVVEDDREVLNLMSKYLSMRGHDVIAARCAEEALATFQIEPIPLVILDWVLPGMDGLELCRRMRAFQGGDASVIVMMTGHRRAEVSSVLDAGANDFLSKPFSFPLLDVRLTIAERQVGEIQERKVVHAGLLHRALHDPLTDLPNRVLFWDRLQQAIRMGERNHASVAVLLLDLDGFKNVNDAFGHVCGDRVLEQVGVRLANVTRVSDTLARVGGDEFAVVQPATNRSSARSFARRILDGFAEPLLVTGRTLSLGASIGIAVYPQHGTDGETLVQRADAAMYRAKQSRGGYAVCDPARDAEWMDRFAVPNGTEPENRDAARSDLF